MSNEITPIHQYLNPDKNTTVFDCMYDTEGKYYTISLIYDYQKQTLYLKTLNDLSNFFTAIQWHGQILNTADFQYESIREIFSPIISNEKYYLCDIMGINYPNQSMILDDLTIRIANKVWHFNLNLQCEAVAENTLQNMIMLSGFILDDAPPIQRVSPK